MESETGTRRCTKCQSSKPLSEFYRTTRGLGSRCRACHISEVRQRNRRLADDARYREQRRAQKRRWRERQRVRRSGRPRTRADDCSHLVYRLGPTPTCLVCGRFLPKVSVTHPSRPEAKKET